ncbi:DUF6173 family protein [Pleomorphomonas koreensis]|uniref:DUF6173 family protein n=1 Tax=Pleomorphomonas koreensis TaxID=257440 RepID=UPI00069FB9B6|nr:DUF6173 family protein [Pleomorphomonas koreensis]
MSRDFTFPNLTLPNMDHVYKEIAETQDRRAGRLDAEDIFNYLLKRVSEFEASLSESEEIGLQLANFGRAAEIHIRSILHHNPNILEFSGVDIDGNNVSLIQHISQLNFLLVALKPIEEKPFRIGFR